MEQVQCYKKSFLLKVEKNVHVKFLPSVVIYVRKALAYKRRVPYGI